MSDFYEDDEPIEDIRAAFAASPTRGTTGPTERWISDPSLPAYVEVNCTTALGDLTFMGLPMQRLL